MNVIVIWTPEQDAILRAGWAEGRSARQITEAMSHLRTIAGTTATRNAVIGRSRRLGLSARQSPIKRPPGAVPPPRKPRPKPGPIGTFNPFPPNGRCVYPHGHPPDFRFCGAPVLAPGAPYCREHTLLCHVREGVRQGPVDTGPLVTRKHVIKGRARRGVINDPLIVASVRKAWLSLDKVHAIASGHSIALSTMYAYVKDLPKRGRGQSWATPADAERAAELLKVAA